MFSWLLTHPHIIFIYNTTLLRLLEVPSQDSVPSASSVQCTPSTTSSTTALAEKDAYQERMRKMREQFKVAEREKKRISEQVCTYSSLHNQCYSASSVLTLDSIPCAIVSLYYTISD